MILDAVRNGKSIKVSKGNYGVEVTGEISPKTNSILNYIYGSLRGFKASKGSALGVFDINSQIMLYEFTKDQIHS